MEESSETRTETCKNETSAEGKGSVGQGEATTATTATAPAAANPDTPLLIPDPGMQTGGEVSWRLIGGDWFCMDKDGSVLTGWQQSTGGRWYYLNQTTGQRRGAMETGFLFDPASGNYFYLDPASGAMADGWTCIDGSNYFFMTAQDGSGRTWDPCLRCFVLSGARALPQGAMLRNTVTEDGYIIDNEGICAGKISVD